MSEIFGLKCTKSKSEGYAAEKVASESNRSPIFCTIRGKDASHKPEDYRRQTILNKNKNQCFLTSHEHLFNLMETHFNVDENTFVKKK